MELGSTMIKKCGLKCKTNYSPTTPFELTCAGTFPDEATTGLQTCYKNKCNPFVFPKGVVPGDNDGCTVGIELEVDATSCSLKCAEGYEGTPSTGVLTCPEDGIFGSDGRGGVAVGQPTCTEIQCPEYAFPSHIAGDNSADA